MATEIFRIEGLEDLESKLSELMALGARGDTLAKQTLVKAAKNAMEPVLQEVQTTAPADSGMMRDSAKLTARIPNETDRRSTMVNQSDAAIAVVSVKKSAVSLAQELGTKKLHAQPFLRPALARHKDIVVEKFKDDLAEYINQFITKQARRRK